MTRDTEFSGILDGHDPVDRSDRCGEGIEHGGLSCTGGAGNKDVVFLRHRGSKQFRTVWQDRSLGDKCVEVRNGR